MIAMESEHAMHIDPLRYSSLYSPASSIRSLSMQLMLDEVLEKHDEERIVLGTPAEESEEQKKTCLNRLLTRAASNGDAKKVQEIIRDGRQYLDLDAQDDDGTTPLIYAACFGHIDVLYALITAGADVNAQDKSGWSALMWATTNNHDKIAKSLLDHGASTTTKSRSGRTVMQYVKHAFTHDGANNEKLLEVFSTPQDNTGLAFSWTGDLTAGGYYKSNETEKDSDRERQRALESADNLDIDLETLGFDENEPEEDTPMEFNWDVCYPGQMFVFSPDDIDFLVETFVTKQKPLCSREQRFTPANVLFLAARFAHYYSSNDLLEQLLDLAIIKMSEVVTTRKEVPFLAFWMANCNQLLYYFKKDTGMVTSTVEYQMRLFELVSEIYELLVKDVQRRLDLVISPALLFHESIPLGEVKFEREKSRSIFAAIVPDSPILRPSTMPSGRGVYRSKTVSMTYPRSNRRSTMLSRHSLASQPVGPRSVTALLSSTLFILQTYSVHPTLIHYTLTQLFYYISAEVFNQILTTKGLCCRSRAMQVRYNIAVLEEWVRFNHLPKSLFLHLRTVIELLQYLQCMSQLQDLQAFVETIRELPRLNPLQIRLVALMYRYEIVECKLPDEIRLYIEQAAIDTRRRALQPQDSESTDDCDAKTATSQRSVVDLDRDANGQLGETDVAELMDPEHMIPFSLPTVSEMDLGWGAKGKDCGPSIPDNMVELFDHRSV